MVAEFLQVRTGTEVTARAGQNRHIRFRVGIELAKRIGQRLGRLAIDGIARFRPLNGYDGDAVFDSNSNHVYTLH